jgi:predicted ATPase
VTRGDLRLARECGERAVSLAQDLHPTLLIAARASLAGTQVRCGDFAAACLNLDALIAPCLGAAPPPLQPLYWNHAAVLAGSARALWPLGYPDRALRVAGVALQMAHALEAPVAIVQALGDGICFARQLRREGRAVKSAVDELLALIDEGRGYPVMRAFAPLYRGWVQAQEGSLEEGIASLRRGVATWDAGFGILRAHWRLYLAEALALAGRVEEGLAVLGEAWQEVQRTGDRFSEAELHRLRGELLLQRGGEGAEEQAEESYQRAIALAREQEARSWELRATTSLARLWQRQGRVAEAREALATIYGWFTEGFDTPDLQEAAGLLRELGGAPAA